jgi:hypothetical protein
LFYFLHSATAPNCRVNLEFLIAANTLLTLIDQEETTGTDSSRQIMQLVRDIRHHFLNENNLNISPAVNKSFLSATSNKKDDGQLKTYEEMVDEVKKVMVDVKGEVMSLVRTNQWSHLKAWHRNRLAELVHPLVVNAKGNGSEGNGSYKAQKAASAGLGSVSVDIPSNLPLRWTRTIVDSTRHVGPRQPVPLHAPSASASALYPSVPSLTQQPPSALRGSLLSLKPHGSPKPKDPSTPKGSLNESTAPQVQLLPPVASGAVVSQF